LAGLVTPLPALHLLPEKLLEPKGYDCAAPPQVPSTLSDAEQFIFVPPCKPLHVQDQGPLPVPQQAVPELQVLVQEYV
jgi:hypothetical protein